MPVSQGRHPFPLSRKRVTVEGFDREKDNPLAFLHPNEALAAELFVLAAGDPATVATMPAGKPRKWSVLLSGAYATRCREAFGFDLMPHHRKGLQDNPAWQAYVRKLTQEPRDAVMAMLKTQSVAAAKDYLWSREAAKQAGDYKETRVAAADHLDRIGATEKPENVAQNIVVVLRGRNFDEGNLMRELPATEVEVVTVKESNGDT